MKKVLFALAVLLLPFGATVGNAVTLSATQVLGVNCSVNCPGAGRDDPLAVLGAADGTFYSLGLGGDVMVGFGQTFTGPGSIVEVTYGNVPGYGVESVDVFVGLVSTGIWTKVAAVLNTAAQTGFTFGFSGVFDAMKLVDTTTPNCGTSRSCTGDGFDVDAITVAAVPLPAAGLLLLAGLGGLASLRRRKRPA